MAITQAYNWATGEIEKTVSGVKKLVTESSKALKNRKKDREKYMKGDK